MRSAIVVAGTMLLTVAVVARGDAQSVNPGERVRLTSRNQQAPRLTGTITDIRGDTIFVSRDSTGARIESMLSSHVRSVERSVGRRSKLREGMGYGAVAGGLLGAAIGVGSYREEPPINANLCQPGTCIPLRFEYFGRGFHAAAGATAGIVAGALVGGIIGSMSSTDRWRRVSPSLGSLDVQIRSSGRATRAGFSLTFGAAPAQ